MLAANRHTFVSWKRLGNTLCTHNTTTTTHIPNAQYYIARKMYIYRDGSAHIYTRNARIIMIKRRTNLGVVVPTVYDVLCMMLQWCCACALPRCGVYIIIMYYICHNVFYILSCVLVRVCCFGKILEASLYACSCDANRRMFDQIVMTTIYIYIYRIRKLNEYII